MAARKKFIDIKIPLLNETLSVLGTQESLQGKTIKLDLTRQLRGKSLEITFRIFPSKGTPAGANKDGKLIGLPKKMLLMKFYIGRMMRKRTNYIEDSIKIECADIRAVIKPFLITRKKVSRAVRNHLRNAAKEFLLDYIKEKNYLKVCEEILMGSIQKAMLPKLKKIYPLSLCEIRIFEISKSSDLDSVKEMSETEKPGPSKGSSTEEEKPGPSSPRMGPKGGEESPAGEEEKSKKKPSKKEGPKKLNSKEKTAKKEEKTVKKEVKTKKKAKTEKKDVKKTVKKSASKKE